MDYRWDFIEFMINSGALRFGDFTLKSGRKSPYFINTGVFDTGDKIERLGSYYAAIINGAMDAGDAPKDISTVFGPAYKGIPLAVATAASLARERGRDVGYTFNRKEAKDHGEGGGLVGRALRDGDEIVLVDDVITAGTAMREVVPLIRAAADVKICGLFLSVDRMERGGSGNGLSAVNEIRRDLGIPVHPIVTVKDILEYAPLVDVDGKPAIDEDAKRRMLSYMAEFCVHS